MAAAIVELSESALRTHESSPSPSPKVGPPRLDPRKALLQDFYEPLLVLEMLQRRLGCLARENTPRLDTTTQDHPWWLFLNQITWLCDHSNGGNSTSAIAVEATATGPKFWLAANFDRRRKGVSHLNVILTKLANLDLSHPETHGVTLDEILRDSLLFSTKKFKNYRRKLLSYVKKLKGQLPNSCGELAWLSSAAQSASMTCSRANVHC
jgi:hypothetical protein